jgi:hypothetical protein
MSATAHDAVVPEREVPRPSSIATMAASWSLAGGLAGGLLIVGLILIGRIHPDGLVAVVMAVLGSVFGAMHGAVLGHLGRSVGAESGRRWREWAIAALAAAGALMVAVSAALWLSMSAVAIRAGSPSSWIILTGSGVVCLGVFLWATVLGWRALESAFARWPDHWLGSWLVFGVFMLLVGTLLLLRPALPGTGLQLTALAAVVVAALATLWIALPAIVMTLRLTHRR